MSRRYILIEFDDKDTAAKLKKQLDKATAGGKMFRVVGYFAAPEGPYCNCDPDLWTYQRGRKYAPSKYTHKAGWTKCLVCNNYRDIRRYTNLLTVEKVASFAKRVVKHWRTKQPMEVVSHISSIEFINKVNPEKSHEQ